MTMKEAAMIAVVVTTEGAVTIIVVAMTVEVVMTAEETPITKKEIGIALSVTIPTFRSELNVIDVASQREEEALTNAMTAEDVTIIVAVMTAEVVMTVVVIIQIMTGIVPSVIIPTLHSELNVIDVASQREEEALINATTAEVVMIIVAVMTAEETPTTKTEIGIALSVIIPTLHSELNVIDVASQREEEAPVKAMTAEVVTIIVAVMTVEVVTIDVVVMTEEAATGTKVAVTIQIMTGNVANVKTQISHSEQNVIDVASQKEKVALVLESGKVMTADLAIEETLLNLELGIGTARNVENQISLRETTVSAVDALRELVDRKTKDITGN